MTASVITMADEHEIIDVGELHPTPNQPCWYVTTRRPDGVLHQLIFPKTTMEWRAAEYGLTDPDEILDIILHEQHRPRETPAPPMSLVNPAPRKAAAKKPVTLWTAASTSEARAAHRAAIAAVKKTVRVVDPSGHLAHITRRHGMTAAGIRAKAEQADMARWRVLYGDLPVATTTTEVPDA
jgi:hypothetical protein